MSNFQVLRRGEVLPAALAQPPTSSYDGHTLRLFWIERGADVKTLLCKGQMVGPQKHRREETVDGQATEALYVRLPPGRAYLGLISGQSVFDFHGEP